MPVGKFLPQEFWDDLSPQQPSKKTKTKPTRKRAKRSIPRERKHKATAAKSFGGFVRLTNTFSRDGTLSPDAKSVGLVLASRANYGTGLVSVKPEDLQKESNMGSDRAEDARKELKHAGYIKKIPIRDSHGHIKGWKWYVTNKLVHRENKALSKA